MVVDEVEELDAAAALLAFGDLRATRDRAERDILLLAAHFADLHHPDSTPRGARTLPGTERGIRLAGTGTPLVREFALAEAAAELHLTTFSARRLIGDALETRHRLPAIWARVLAGEAVTRLVRAVAQATRDLTAAQAGTVDTALADLVDGRLPYTRFRDILDAAVIAADPDAAADRERAAATDQFAKVGQSNDHGHKTLYVRTDAAAMTRIDTTIAYLADALATLGDPDPEHLRRVKALLIMANPDQALTLIQALATHTTRTPGAADGPRYDADDHPLPTDDTDASDEADADSGAPATDQARRRARGQRGLPHRSGRPRRAQRPVPTPGLPAPTRPSRPNPAEPFLKPFRPGEMPPCPCRGGTYTLPTSLLPEIVLYLHLHADTLHARQRRRPLGRRRTDQRHLHPRLPRPLGPLHHQRRHRPRRPRPRRRLRDPPPPPRSAAPTHPGRHLPLRPQHQPPTTDRPQQGLPAPQQGRTTRTDRPAQPRQDDHLPPPRQDPRRLAGPTTLPRHLPLAKPPRQHLPRRPHRHPPAPPTPTHRPDRQAQPAAAQAPMGDVGKSVTAHPASASRVRSSSSSNASWPRPDQRVCCLGR